MRKLGVGQWKGQIWVADDFDDLPEDILALFTGEVETEEYIRECGRRASRAKFEAALAQVSHAEPDEQDRIVE